jgi:hypothetical protein
VAGQPEEQAPQVRQRFKLPPSGRISMTLSIKVLFFLAPSSMVSVDISSSLDFAKSRFKIIGGVCSLSSS